MIICLTLTDLYGGEREKIMANITTTNTAKNAVEIRAELTSNGTKIEYVVINGQKVGILGTTSEKDKQNAIKALQTALDASNGNTYEMMQKLSTIATIEEKEIKPDEMIEVNGVEIIISYEAKTAYTIDGEEIVNCTDLPDMPNEAIKAVLTARVETALAEREDYYDEDEECNCNNHHNLYQGYWGDEYV